MTPPLYQSDTMTLICGDALGVLSDLPDESVQCCVTSPPYWGLRSYLPDAVKMKKDTPPEILEELESFGIFPIDHTAT